MTSLKNSPGIAFDNWKDGKPLQIITAPNNYAIYNIQPEQYKFLKHTGRCQEESFYECIASKLDTIEFKGSSDGSVNQFWFFKSNIEMGCMQS